MELTLFDGAAFFTFFACVIGIEVLTKSQSITLMTANAFVALFADLWPFYSRKDLVVYVGNCYTTST